MHLFIREPNLNLCFQGSKLWVHLKVPTCASPAYLPISMSTEAGQVEGAYRKCLIQAEDFRRKYHHRQQSCFSFHLISPVVVVVAACDLRCPCALRGAHVQVNSCIVPLYGCRSVGGGPNYQNGSSGAHGALSSSHILLIISLSETYGFVVVVVVVWVAFSSCALPTLSRCLKMSSFRILSSEWHELLEKIHSCWGGVSQDVVKDNLSETHDFLFGMGCCPKWWCTAAYTLKVFPKYSLLQNPFVRMARVLGTFIVAEGV